MIKINNSFIDDVTMPLIVTDCKGLILKMNKFTINVLKNMDFSPVTSIQEINKEFYDKVLNGIHKFQWNSFLDNLVIDVKVHKVTYEKNNSCYLYVFNDLKHKMEEVNVTFDSIDDVVLIVNKDRVIERLNKAFDKLTGLNGRAYVGRSIYDLKAEGVMEQSVILNVFKSKKTIVMNVKYKNGSIVTYTGIPIYNKNKEVSKVIATGRNITKLVNLELKLKKAEEQKQIYLSKLKELQVNLKKNNIIYSSDKMKKILTMTMKVAKTDSSIFIKGESGVGKEEIAKFIHENSNRKEKPFIPINCAAIPGELLESYLFGYEEGAFTGAKKGGKKGLFEKANGGTIFLDEIGELNIQMQTKLLRVLQENKIMPVGGNSFVPIDVRYVCATNLSKEELSDNSKFRQDLYYRLSVVPIYVPPLRIRKDDILPLVCHFLNFYNEKYARSIKLNRNVMKFLYNYSWPGNVRQLKNVVERVVILAEENIVDEYELKTMIELDEPRTQENKSSNIAISGLMNLNEVHRKVDEIMIGRAVEEYGTIIKAAKILGIDPSTIHRKLKRGYINIRANN